MAIYIDIINDLQNKLKKKKSFILKENHNLFSKCHLNIINIFIGNLYSFPLKCVD